MGVIVFNGISSRDFGIEVETAPDYQAAQRNVRDLDVPGRNGSLYIDDNTFANVERAYSVSFVSKDEDGPESFRSISSAIAEWLAYTSGYCKLTDSYEPDYYRLARFIDEFQIDNIYNQAGSFELKFDCRPERFLVSGVEPVTITSGQYLINPTKFAAKPLIQITGSGNASLYVGSRRVQIAMGTTYTTATIDCEKEHVYTGSTSLDSITTLTGGGFPILQNGKTTITFSNISSLKITPNWWTL